MVLSQLVRTKWSRIQGVKMSRIRYWFSTVLINALSILSGKKGAQVYLPGMMMRDSGFAMRV
jgi:hypothetical protein